MSCYFFSIFYHSTKLTVPIFNPKKGQKSLFDVFNTNFVPCHHLRNNFYGGNSASLNLKLCRSNEDLKEVSASSSLKEKELETILGRSKFYNIDLCPKFLMAGGDLVKMLLKSRVTRYLEFRSIGGSYVYNKKQEKLLEVNHKNWCCYRSKFYK